MSDVLLGNAPFNKEKVFGALLMVILVSRVNEASHFFQVIAIVMNFTVYTSHSVLSIDRYSNSDFS